MTTTDGTVIRDCRTCKFSEYTNRFSFTCWATDPATKGKTRPCKCKNYAMDEDYAKANNVKLHKPENYVYDLGQ